MFHNLAEIRDFLEAKGIYWFDLLGKSHTFLQYEIEADRSEQVRSLLKKYPNREIDFAFVLLQCEKFDEAQQYLISLNELIAEKGDKFYLNRHKETIDSLLSQLQNAEHTAIRDVLYNNINQSLENLSLGKIKQYEPNEINVQQYLNIEYENKKLKPIPGGRGVEHYHQILDGDEDMFLALKNRLKHEYPFIEISDSRFALNIHEKASFHFALNKLDAVKDDITEVCQWFERKGEELSHLSKKTMRIEFWCDFTIQTDVNTYPAKDKIVQIVSGEISNSVFIPGRFKFVD